MKLQALKDYILRLRRIRLEKKAIEPREALHFSLVCERIAERLPPLVAKARRHRIEEAAAQVIHLEPAATPFVDETHQEQSTRVAVRAVQSIAIIHQLVRTEERKLALLESGLRRARDAAEEWTLISNFLADRTQRGISEQGELEASENVPKIDSIRQRVDKQRATLYSQSEVLFLFLAGHFADASVLPNTELVLSATDAVIEVLRSGLWWQEQYAAAATLLSLAQTLKQHQADEPVRGRMLECAIARLDEERFVGAPWVDARLFELLCVLDVADAEKRLPVLVDERASIDDPMAFVRSGLCLEAYARIAPRPFDALQGLVPRIVAQGEQVQMRYCSAIASLDFEDTKRLAETLLDSADDEETPVHRVAIATLVQALAARLRSKAAANSDVDDVDDVDIVSWCLAMSERYSNAFDADVVQQSLALLLDEAAQRSFETQHPALREWQKVAEERMRSADRLSNAERWAALAELLWLRRHHSDLLECLHAQSKTILPGSQTTVLWRMFSKEARRSTESDMALGRVLGAVSATSYGLGASRGRFGLKLYRGERRVRRLWRILYELKRPAPNKRQGALHTIGRQASGRIRAHPGRLDEATATVVPGERVFIERVETWARHLPLVDDLLDLPFWSNKPRLIFSSFGVVTLRPAQRLLARLRARIILAFRYHRYAEMRNLALAADTPEERTSYIRSLARDLGVAVAFSAHEYEVPQGQESHDLEEPPDETASSAQNQRGKAHPLATAFFPPTAALFAVLFLPGEGLDRLRGWWTIHRYYFGSATENSQLALLCFLAATLLVFVIQAYRKRSRILAARQSIALSVGGWGTRGKSGTERIKAALFHGLGYQVFVKTTGCEAMFIHALPGRRANEVFLYRPYDKATIWEQRDVLSLGSRLGAEVFLWECMALNPRYVRILQHEWMRDDIVTLTNAYPDHEDVQGPAGEDVATVIGQFIPTRGSVIASETNFLPLFEQIARQNETALQPVTELDAALISADVLSLFPYAEHPKNIALVAALAERLDVHRDVAMCLMANMVVPDLGVLKQYAAITIRSRRMSFVNACSANERTGFMSSWRRMGLDDLSPDEQPERAIVSVINNRADRIPRSRVFANIIVRDIRVDKYVLIGTNLDGLRGYIGEALDEFLRDYRIWDPEEKSQDKRASEVNRRMEGLRQRLRIAVPGVSASLRIADVYFGARLSQPAKSALEGKLATLFSEQASLDYEANLARVKKSLEGIVLDEASLDPKTREPSAIESDAPPEAQDALAHFCVAVARQLTWLGAQNLSARCDKPQDEEALKRAYRKLFMAKIEQVDDSLASGDQVVAAVCDASPPGSEVSVVGMQNIKGTGLDFVYRWLAVDFVVERLVELERGTPRVKEVCDELLSFGDHGLFSAQLLKHYLESRPPSDSDHEAFVGAHGLLLSQVTAIASTKQRALGATAKPSRFDKVIDGFEATVDFLDAVRRRHEADGVIEQIANETISHGEAAVVMRDIVGRQKGGWIKKAYHKRRAKR